MITNIASSDRENATITLHIIIKKENEPDCYVIVVIDNVMKKESVANEFYQWESQTGDC